MGSLRAPDELECLPAIGEIRDVRRHGSSCSSKLLGPGLDALFGGRGDRDGRPEPKEQRCRGEPDAALAAATRDERGAAAEIERESSHLTTH